MSIYFFIPSKNFSRMKTWNKGDSKKKHFQAVQSVTQKNVQKHLRLWGPPQMGGGFEQMLKKKYVSKNHF